jgi:hypothetical protein
MQKRLFALIVIVFLGLTGCQSQNVRAQSEPVPAAALPAGASQPIEEVVDHCAACHTDKEELISTAKPEEVLEKESTGAG